MCIKITVHYPNYDNRNIDEPENGPTERRTKDGNIHPANTGKRLKEVCFEKICKRRIHSPDLS